MLYANIWAMLGGVRNCSVVKLLQPITGRVWLERLPAHCPELNPDEGVWNYLKRVCLKHRTFSDLKELRKGLRRAIRTFRSHPQLIQACLHKEVMFKYKGCVTEAC